MPERDQENNIESRNGYSNMQVVLGHNVFFYSQFPGYFQILTEFFFGCRLGGTSVEQYWKTKLDTLQADMTYLEKKQAQLDREQQLVDKEDELSQRLVNIESYEQEVSR